jgi:hypothetical protein
MERYPLHFLLSCSVMRLCSLRRHQLLLMEVFGFDRVEGVLTDLLPGSPWLLLLFLGSRTGDQGSPSLVVLYIS